MVFPLCIFHAEYEAQVLVTQSCLTLCNPMDCSLPGSSVHGIFQARILEWVAISFSNIQKKKKSHYIKQTNSKQKNKPAKTVKRTSLRHTKEQINDICNHMDES